MRTIRTNLSSARPSASHIHFLYEPATSSGRGSPSVFRPAPVLPSIGHSRRLSRLPARLDETGDPLPIECRNVVRLAACKKVAVNHRFLIYPLPAGVADIGLERRP